MLKDDIQKIVQQSNSSLSGDPLSSNLRIDPTTTPAIIKSQQEDFVDDDAVSTDTYAIPDDK